MNVDRILLKYEDKLCLLPPSGGGGCHAALLGLANLAVFAGLDEEAFLEDVRTYIDDTRRAVSDREILQAYDRARRDHADGKVSRDSRPSKPTNPRTSQRQEALNGFKEKCLAKGKGSTPVDFARKSPFPVPEEPVLQTISLLEALYRPSDLLFLGDSDSPGVLRRTIFPVESLLDYFRSSSARPPHIMPNPLTGKSAPTRGGDKKTLRGDRCIHEFRFAVVEFDGMSREDQCAFYAGSGLPIHALIDSGGKSIHAWVAIDGIESLEQWDSVIKVELFNDLLAPIGCDGSCSNASRLSRCPGHLRPEKGWQRLLYLDPKGGELRL